jgi:hypothetical protein
MRTSYLPVGPAEHSVTNLKVHIVRSALAARYVSFHGRQRRFRNSGIRKYYYISMTALIDLDLLPRRAFLSTTFALPSFTSHAQAFGREPNALPKLCNLLRLKSFGSPGRIRTSNISVNSQETNFIRTCRRWREPREIS